METYGERVAKRLDTDATSMTAKKRLIRRRGIAPSISAKIAIPMKGVTRTVSVDSALSTATRTKIATTAHPTKCLTRETCEESVAKRLDTDATSVTAKNRVSPTGGTATSTTAKIAIPRRGLTRAVSAYSILSPPINATRTKIATTTHPTKYLTRETCEESVAKRLDTDAISMTAKKRVSPTGGTATSTSAKLAIPMRGVARTVSTDSALNLRITATKTKIAGTAHPTICRSTESGEESVSKRLDTSFDTHAAAKKRLIPTRSTARTSSQQSLIDSMSDATCKTKRISKAPSDHSVTTKRRVSTTIKTERRQKSGPNMGLDSPMRSTSDHSVTIKRRLTNIKKTERRPKLGPDRGLGLSLSCHSRTRKPSPNIKSQKKTLTLQERLQQLPGAKKGTASDKMMRLHASDEFSYNNMSICIPKSKIRRFSPRK